MPSEIHSQCSGGVSPSTSPAVIPSTGGDATRLVRVGVGARVRARVRVRGGIGSRVRVSGRLGKSREMGSGLGLGFRFG